MIPKKQQGKMKEKNESITDKLSSRLTEQEEKELGRQIANEIGRAHV